MRAKDTINEISGVAAGQPTLSTLSTNRRYFSVDMTATGKSSAEGNPALTNPADIIGDVQIEVGNKLIRNVTADFLVLPRQVREARRVSRATSSHRIRRNRRPWLVQMSTILACKCRHQQLSRSARSRRPGFVPCPPGAAPMKPCNTPSTSGVNAEQNDRASCGIDRFTWNGRWRCPEYHRHQASGPLACIASSLDVSTSPASKCSQTASSFDSHKRRRTISTCPLRSRGTTFSNVAAVIEEHGQVFHATASPGATHRQGLPARPVRARYTAIVESLASDYV
jgi:hypothetical protein